MFKENRKHLQGTLFDYIGVSDKKKKKLENSKYKMFYDEIFCNIKETEFEDMYSTLPSRPNYPVNILFGSLILKHMRNWTFEKLFENVEFNLLTRTALGLNDFNEETFSDTTLFNFINYISDYQISTGINLFEHVFDGLTKRQLKKFNIKTDIQRSDSFLAGSDICNYSRLQILVEILRRLYKNISEKEQKKFKDNFSRYLDKTSGQYVYQLKKTNLEKELEKIGRTYYVLNKGLKKKYNGMKIFEIFQRVFFEHFKIEDKKAIAIENKQLKSDILQSPDDEDATYRKKRNKMSKGYSVNVTETCNQKNDFNLITDIVVEPNIKDDSVILDENLMKIKAKTPDLNELHSDGGYASEKVDEKMKSLGINQIQTAIRGTKPDIRIDITKTGKDEYEISCPNQKVISKKTKTRYKAEFKESICLLCNKNKECKLQKQKNKRVLYFRKKDEIKRNRMKNKENLPKERQNLRTNVEATMNEFTCKLKNGKKLKVRTIFKAKMFAFLTGVGINFGRIYRNSKKVIKKDGNIAVLLKLYFSNIKIITKLLENIIYTKKFA